MVIGITFMFLILIRVQVCFAYLGGIQSKLYLHYTYTNSESEDRSAGRWFDVEDIEATDRYDHFA